MRVFLDSNVVISACLSVPNRFEPFWSIPGIDILTSQHVLEEAGRNLKRADQRARLWHLVYRSHLVPDQPEAWLPERVSLPAKDAPILLAAIAGHAEILVTGDLKHFGPYLDQTVAGVRVETPYVFRGRFPEHFISEFPSR